MQMIGRRRTLAGVLAGRQRPARPGRDSLFFLAGTSWINLSKLRTKLCCHQRGPLWSESIADRLATSGRSVNFVNDHACWPSFRAETCARIDRVPDPGSDGRGVTVVRRVDFECAIARLARHNVREGGLAVSRRAGEQ